MKENKKIIKGRGKIHFHDEKDREKMEKKYPEVKFEKMNPLTFTTTYKGNEQFDVEIKAGDTKIPCSFKKWAWPWKYGSKVELRLHFKDLKKKAITHITGGIQGKLFKLYRYDYEKMMKDDPKLNKKVSKKTKKKEKPQIIMVEYSKGKAIRKVYNVDKLSSKQKKKTQKGGKQTLKKGGAICLPCLLPFTIPSKRKRGGGKQTFKKEQKKENKDYYVCIRKSKKIKDKKTRKKSLIKCNDKRSKKLKLLKKKYPKEWKEFKENYGKMRY